jgi:hypothetical protein
MDVHTSDQWRNNLYFFSTIAYSYHLFLYKMWLFIIFSHFLSGIYQTMNWQGQCQKLLCSCQILLSCKLTCSDIYHKKFLQRLPWWMVTLFFLFADIWAGTNSQVQFPIVSRKSLTVDSCSWGSVIIFNDYNLSAC